MSAQTGLSREVVLHAAAQIIDVSGWRQFTMTALAGQLGVRTPTLYHHVGGAEQLRADVQVQALEALGARFQQAAMGQMGPECFRAMAAALCDYAVEHPGLYELTQSKPVDPERLERANRSALAASKAALRSFGITEPSRELMLTCLAPLHGVLSLEQSGAIGSAAQRARIYGEITELVITHIEAQRPL